MLSHGRLIVTAPLACALFALQVEARNTQAAASLIQRVVARSDPPPRQYRALRRMEAQSEHFSASAWMDVWTQVDPVDGFRYDIAGEGGTNYVRKHVLKPWIEGEKKMWTAGDPGRAALTLANYEFKDRGLAADGLAWLGLKPLRKDVLLVDGSIYVNPDDGDLDRIEGRLSKAPSFWARRVDVVRRYRRINGIRVPVTIDSTAQVLLAGRSTLHVTYEYETINGQRVGSPKPRTPASAVLHD